MVALAAAAPDWLRCMILVSAYTGLRLFEAAGLRAGDLVHGEDGWHVVVRYGKGGYRDEESVVFEPALSLLLQLNRLTDEGRLLMTTTIGTMISRQYVAKAFAPLAREVGFFDGDGKPGTFHALRHFHACYLLDRGATPIDVAAQLRQHDRGEEVIRRYGKHHSTRAALGRIAQIGG